MDQTKKCRQIDKETFSYRIPKDREFRILQLTDLHLGFGVLSRSKDQMAMKAVTTIIKKSKPDIIILTGDSIFPFLPKSGTMNNRKQAKKLTAFMDHFQIPYAIVMGNHDAEMGASCKKEELMDLFAAGKYSICTKGRADITGVGNYFILLQQESKTDEKKEADTVLALALLDSNMYGDGWFYSGFDCIHKDQTDWCMKKLDRLREKSPALEALAFFHMPPQEFKDAYEKMKLGDEHIQYHFGSIAELGEFFGISTKKGTFYKEAVRNGMIKGMFCGHDHLNTISLTYQGIRLTYGMSIDYLGYKGIENKYTQRGGTLITRSVNGTIRVKPVPLIRVVSTEIHGVKKTENRYRHSQECLIGFI